MIQIENINLLFHHDEYKPGRYTDIIAVRGKLREVGVSG
jgi:hypothetical protein